MNATDENPSDSPPFDAHVKGESCWLLPLLLGCVFVPTITLPIAERIVIIGPICNIGVSIALVFLWNRFGPSSIKGMLNGIVSTLVWFVNFWGILLSPAAGSEVRNEWSCRRSGAAPCCAGVILLYDGGFMETEYLQVEANSMNELLVVGQFSCIHAASLAGIVSSDRCLDQVSNMIAAQSYEYHKSSKLRRRSEGSKEPPKWYNPSFFHTVFSFGHEQFGSGLIKRDQSQMRQRPTLRRSEDEPGVEAPNVGTGQTQSDAPSCFQKSGNFVK